MKPTIEELHAALGKTAEIIIISREQATALSAALDVAAACIEWVDGPEPFEWDSMVGVARTFAKTVVEAPDEQEDP